MSTGAGSTTASLVVTVADIHTGANLLSHKQTSSPTNGIKSTGTSIFAAQYQKSQINVYSHGKEGVVQKLLVPERPQCVSISPCETYLAMGSENGRLLVWELSSGTLLTAIDAHYQAITCVEFSQDSAFVITGSSDSRILVWNTLDFVDNDSNFESIQPVHAWTHHSLAITGIRIGCGRSIEARVFTSSLDGTVRQWDLSSGRLLTTVVTSGKVHSLTVDPLERAVYAGLDDAVAIVDLYQKNPGTGVLSALGGAGQIVTLSDKSSRILQGQHGSPVTALALSYDGTILFSGDLEGRVFAWDLPTMQVLREHKRHAGPISSIECIARGKTGDDRGKQNRLENGKYENGPHDFSENTNNSRQHTSFQANS
jgi:pre-rRNA-processing protein IPI3